MVFQVFSSVVIVFQVYIHVLHTSHSAHGHNYILPETYTCAHREKGSNTCHYINITIVI